MSAGSAAGDARECDECGSRRPHLALGMRMPGSCMVQPWDAAKDMRWMLQFDMEQMVIAAHGLRKK